MSNYNLESIKNDLLLWHDRNMQNQSIIKITKNNEKILIIDYTFKWCIAQLTIMKANFAPYKLVSYEAVSLYPIKLEKKAQSELIYFFYDSDDTEKQDVIDEIQNAVEYCINYVPGDLEKKYVGKKGYLKMKNSNSKIKVHPDDCDRISAILSNQRFICIGIDFQYLILNNNSFNIRVLPILFEMLDD